MMYCSGTPAHSSMLRSEYVKNAGPVGVWVWFVFSIVSHGSAHGLGAWSNVANMGLI